MNVTAVVRRPENGGFTHDQAAILAEVLHDRASERLEKMIHVESKSTVKWLAGMMVVQTVAILTGTVGLVKLFL